MNESLVGSNFIWLVGGSLTDWFWLVGPSLTDWFCLVGWSDGSIGWHVEVFCRLGLDEHSTNYSELD